MASLAYSLGGSMIVSLVGLILSLFFGLSNYLLLDNPQMGAIESMKISCRLMKGNKGRYFYISLSFLPLNIAVAPYQTTSYHPVAYIINQRTKSIFYEAKVAVNVIALSRIFVQNGENIRQKELESRIEDWLSVEDDSVVEGALSLVFELCKFEMTPFDLLQAILPFVGDDKPNLSYLAIHILSCSAEDPNLEQLGPKIDMRIKKTISVEELDEGTVHDLAEFIIHAPRSIFSQSTLDDCCAFDDLAIATV